MPMSKEHEGFQATNNFERASRAMPAEREFVEESSVTSEPEANAQARLAKLEADLEKCNRDAAAIKEKDSARYDLLTSIGKAINDDIKKVQQEIMDADGGKRTTQ